MSTAELAEIAEEFFLDPIGLRLRELPARRGDGDWIKDTSIREQPLHFTSIGSKQFALKGLTAFDLAVSPRSMNHRDLRPAKSRIPYLRVLCDSAVNTLQH